MKHGWLKGFIAASTLLMLMLMTGCTYGNSQYGFQIKVPINWSVHYVERSGVTYLEPVKILPNAESALIEIWGTLCDYGPYEEDQETAILDEINRIKNLLYQIDTIKIVQSPTRQDDTDYQIMTATISLPIAGMKDDSASIRMNESKGSLYQPISIWNIRDSRSYLVMVFFYPGESEFINNQALKIINSIKLVCP